MRTEVWRPGDERGSPECRGKQGQSRASERKQDRGLSLAGGFCVCLLGRRAPPRGTAQGRQSTRGFELHVIFLWADVMGAFWVADLYVCCCVLFMSLRFQ